MWERIRNSHHFFSWFLKFIFDWELPTCRECILIKSIPHSLPSNSSPIPTTSQLHVCSSYKISYHRIPLVLVIRARVWGASTRALTALQRPRREIGKNVWARGHGRLQWSRVFWIRQGDCTDEPTAAGTVCTRPAQAVRWKPNIAWGGGQEVPPPAAESLLLLGEGESVCFGVIVIHI